MPYRTKAEHREYSRQYYQRNKGRIRAEQAVYRKNNKPKLKKIAHDYYQSNRADIDSRIRDYRKERRLSDIDYRILDSIKSRFRQLLVQKGNKHTADFLDYTMGELRYHIATKFERGMSWDNWGEWHIDHIAPCASFDHSDPDQVRECWQLSNLQPLWAADNLSKGARGKS